MTESAGSPFDRLDRLDRAALARVHVFPVRHHSPRASAVLAAHLAHVRPSLVLIEGPEDATAFLDVLVDPETRPPVAILGHRTDRTQGSALWPFAAYSPEYVAAKWAAEARVEGAFIDVPVGSTLASYAGHMESATGGGLAGGALAGGALAGDDPPDTVRAPGAPTEFIGIHEACARARGYRSFEEFWEASFEAPAYDPAAFREALLGYAELVRAADRSPLHGARDAFMARRIHERIQAGVAPERIVAVLGAAHAAAILSGDVDPLTEAYLPRPVPCAVTLVPYSFPRLAEQLGYGAGNRAPQYYQRAHDAGCSYGRATLEVLVEFTEHLRLRGFTASLADTIEAYRLAIALAGLRNKAEPGLDEVREATIATLCRGDATHVDGFLWPSVIGRNVGKVARRVGKNALQEEFWREVEARRLPTTDSLEAFALKLNEPVQVETSVFLHRLRVARIPYASYVGKHVGGRSRKARDAAYAPEADALTRVSESWEAQWTPSTDVALVEQIVMGESLADVVGRTLEEQLWRATNAGEAASVLLEAVVTSNARMVAAALRACDAAAAIDDDLPSLARTASVLSGLVSFGSSRALSALGDDAVHVLCRKTFARAVLRVRDACSGTDDAVAGPRRALRTLHDVALAQPLVDKEAWLEAARDLATSFAVNPGAAGLAAGLLYLAQVIDDEHVTTLVALRLSDAAEPARAAGFLEGFLDVNALALVKSRPVVAALDAFLRGIDAPRFRDALPVLRRAFAGLGPTERRYLLENVLGLRGGAARGKTGEAVLLEKDKAELRAMSADLAAAMDDLDDLL